MLLLTRKTRFSAAHRYYLQEWSEEENLRRFGKCALPHGHGHDYTLEVTLSGHADPVHGMVVNIAELKPILEREVVGALDGEYLTPSHPLLGGKIPATEVLAGIAWKRLQRSLGAAGLPARLERVLLAEGRSLWSERFRAGNGAEGTEMTTLTRGYEFAAAHRLHSQELTEAENRELFGKCNNPHGHGHNYVVEVTVSGEPDPRTGLLIDLGEMDEAVHREVVDRYDHRHLNLEFPEFQELVPTSENLVRVIWERLRPALPPGALRRVTVRETERNIFTYEGEGE
jgi:6-pyruvoyltetrahydropterin/6-carboxytetrahydropterin synthase